MSRIIHPDYPTFKPMLSGKFKDSVADIKKLRNYPYIISPKVDGIRCCISQDGTPITRTLKDIPNRFVQERCRYLTRYQPSLAFLDGEFVYGGAPQLTEPNIFQKTSSAVMSHEGTQILTFWYFDSFLYPKHNYFDRLKHITEVVSKAVEQLDEYFRYDPHHTIKFRQLPHQIANNLEELEYWEDKWVTEGFEGLMFRDPSKPYKFNRASVSPQSQNLCKLVRWETNEGEILDIEELEHNDNELTTDERGYAKRSTAKANKRGGDTLGKFIIRVLNGPFAGETFPVGTGEGLTQELRQQLWNTRTEVIGKTITFKWRLHGSKDLPRFPIFKGFRHQEDM